MTAPDRFARPIAAALCAASIAWAVSVPLAPMLLGGGTAPALAAAARIPYAAGALVCHQRADRSFFTRGIRWPVCARCAGLYLSAAAAIAAALLLPRPALRAAGRPALWRAALLLTAAPTAASWAAEHAGLWLPQDLERAWLAVPLGAAVGAAIAVAARGAFTDTPKNLR